VSHSGVYGVMAYGLQNEPLTLSQKFEWIKSLQFLKKDIFVQSSAHPLEILACAKLLPGVVHAFEGDFPM
jgi:hypothetical protein